MLRTQNQRGWRWLRWWTTVITNPTTTSEVVTGVSS
jgi:hypothetical protein